MPRGGRRPGAGGKQIAVGGRQRCRTACDDPARWARFLNAVDMQLEKGETGGFEAMFRHGYGAPPQALDVKTKDESQGNTVRYVCVFSDGSPVGGTLAPSSEELPEDLAE